MSPVEEKFYPYEQNPHVGDFKKFVREGDAQVHPWIAHREQLAANVLQELPSIPVPDYVDPKFLPQPGDQQLELTPYDEFDGMQVVIPPEMYIEGAKRLREYNLRLANHPARIHAMQTLESHGFVPPPARDTIIESDLDRGTILQLADLGHAVDLTQGLLQGDELIELAQKIGELREAGEAAINSDKRLQGMALEVEAFVAQVISQRQAHRTELLATGPFSFVTPNRVGSYIGTGANPDIQGSALAIETEAKMMVSAEIPEIGRFSRPKDQAALAADVMSRLTVDDPLLRGRSDEEKQYIVDHWRKSVVGVVEVSANKALHRVEALAQEGVQTIRIYGHTSGGDVVNTVREIKRQFPNLEVIASQIASADVAVACEAVGADALIIGVGSGGRCTTAALSQLIPTNAALASSLRGKLHIPVIGEGGAIDEPLVSALVGFSGVNGSGTFGGTIETPGGAYFLSRDGKNFFKPYRGEASKGAKYLSTKYGSPRLFATGVPYMPEGAESWKQLIPMEESLTQKVIDQWSRIVLGSVVMGADAGPFTIPYLQSLSPSPLWKKSRTASHLQNTH